MRAQAGNEMGIHSDAISRQGVVSDRWRSNGFEPMRKPRGNGPFLTRATNCPAVTNLFQVAYRANDSGLGLSLDMAPVGLTVVAYADRDASVPVAVTTLVNRRCAVWFPSHGQAAFPMGWVARRRLT